MEGARDGHPVHHVHHVHKVHHVPRGHQRANCSLSSWVKPMLDVQPATPSTRKSITRRKCALIQEKQVLFFSHQSVFFFLFQHGMSNLYRQNKIRWPVRWPLLSPVL